MTVFLHSVLVSLCDCSVLLTHRPQLVLAACQEQGAAVPGSNGQMVKLWFHSQQPWHCARMAFSATGGSFIPSVLTNWKKKLSKNTFALRFQWSVHVNTHCESGPCVWTVLLIAVNMCHIFWLCLLTCMKPQSTSKWMAPFWMSTHMDSWIHPLRKGQSGSLYCGHMAELTFALPM